jgi:hypothetical protein
MRGGISGAKLMLERRLSAGNRFAPGRPTYDTNRGAKNGDDAYK